MKKAKIISSILVTSMLLLVSGVSFAEECEDVYAQESACEDVCFEPYDTCKAACSGDATCIDECYDDYIASGYTCAAECKIQFYSETCPEPELQNSETQPHLQIWNPTGKTKNVLELQAGKNTPPPSLRKPPAY